MTMFREQLLLDGYEKVYQYIDDSFRAFIAIHSTRLGPALGGCRVRSYHSDEDALSDVLKLARGMTYKNAAAGLNFGGGKCVVNALASTPEIMLKVGEIVEELGGSYITAEDVGTTLQDMQIIREKTSHVITKGDGSPWTALGVFSCIQAVRPLIYTTGTPIAVWVEGLGKVGWDLCERLHKAGYDPLYVSDIRTELVEAAINTFHAKPYMGESDDIDVYAPCALGGVVNEDNIDQIFFPIICGSANNQLASDDLAEQLQQLGVIYCPDYIVNAGGVIAAAAEISEIDEHKLRENVIDIGEVLMNCLVLGDKNNKSPLWGAQKLVSIRLDNIGS